MQENLQYILEVYEGSTPLQKLIIKDSLNDLYLWVRRMNQKIEQTPNLESIYIKKLMANFVSQMKSEFTPEELTKIWKHMEWMIKEWKNDFSDFGLFNLTKEKVIFSRTETGKAIREYYWAIGKEELEEIHTLRKFFIDNLLIKEVIWDFEIEDPIFTESIIELIKMTSKKWRRGRREMLDISKITNGYTRMQLSLLRSWLWNKKLKEAYSYFLNDMNVAGYSFNLVDIELLYEKILQKKIAKPVSEMVSIWDTIFIKYNGDEIAFEKWAKPFTILSWLYHSDYNWELWIMDIFPKLFWEDYSGSKHTAEKEQIQNSVDGINRRFRKISDWKNLVQFKSNTITKIT